MRDVALLTHSNRVRVESGALCHKAQIRFAFHCQETLQQTPVIGLLFHSQPRWGVTLNMIMSYKKNFRIQPVRNIFFFFTKLSSVLDICFSWLEFWESTFSLQWTVLFEGTEPSPSHVHSFTLLSFPLFYSFLKTCLHIPLTQEILPWWSIAPFLLWPLSHLMHSSG